MRTMKSYLLSRYVIKYEFISFTAIILIIWLNEIIDVPNLFLGADSTPVNWRESLFESICIMLLGIIILFFTNRLFGRIKVLEDILHICASCKRIRDDEGNWHDLEDYITERSHSQFSHSLCPDCLKKLYPDLKF